MQWGSWTCCSCFLHSSFVMNGIPILVNTDAKFYQVKICQKLGYFLNININQKRKDSNIPVTVLMSVEMRYMFNSNCIQIKEHNSTFGI